jgi:uncharacterized phage infection (PIP) family protein YhgE
MSLVDNLKIEEPLSERSLRVKRKVSSLNKEACNNDRKKFASKKRGYSQIISSKENESLKDNREHGMIDLSQNRRMYHHAVNNDNSNSNSSISGSSQGAAARHESQSGSSRSSQNSDNMNGDQAAAHMHHSEDVENRVDPLG